VESLLASGIPTNGKINNATKKLKESKHTIIQKQPTRLISGQG
jgi:hypothetical protein